MALRYRIVVDKKDFSDLCRKVAKKQVLVPELIIERGRKEKNDSETRRVVGCYFIGPNRIRIYPWKFFPKELSSDEILAKSLRKTLSHELGHFVSLQGSWYWRAFLHKLLYRLRVHSTKFFSIAFFIPLACTFFYTILASDISLLKMLSLWLPLTVYVYALPFLFISARKKCDELQERCAESLGNMFLEKYPEEFAKVISVSVE